MRDHSQNAKTGSTVADQIKAKIQPDNTLADCRAWLEDVARTTTDRHRRRALVADLAWFDREQGNPLFPTQDLLDGFGDDVASVVKDYVTQRLRFDFRFESLRDELKGFGDLNGDAQLMAMKAFAALGLNEADALAQYDVIRRIPHDGITRNILLHGLWFARMLTGHAEKLLELSDEMLSKGEASPNLYYRRAYAHRYLGDYETARRDVLIAMELLPAGANAVHQDYFREFDSIAIGRELHDQVDNAVNESLRQALDTLESRANRVEETLSRSLVSVVEVLGIFVALIGFLGTGAVTIFSGIDYGQKVFVLLALLIGSLAFFSLLRLVIRFGSLPRGR